MFGDAYLDEQREWIERAYWKVGVEAVKPLWRLEPEDVTSRQRRV
nr:hypothetical protein [Candidatus Freyrarchaeum guaymaensis]